MRAVSGPIVERLPDDHQFYALIGRVAAEWAHLEHVLDLTIWDLVRDPNIVASCLTGQMMGITPRFKAIFALTDYHGISQELTGKYKTLRNQLFQLNDERNRYIHDAWFYLTDDKTIAEVGQFKSYSPQTSKLGFDEIPEAKISKFLHKVRGQSNTAIILRAELGAERAS